MTAILHSENLQSTLAKISNYQLSSQGWDGGSSPRGPPSVKRWLFPIPGEMWVFSTPEAVDVKHPVSLQLSSALRRRVVSALRCLCVSSQ